MKHTRHLLLLLLIISLIVSCKKDEFQTTPLSSLIVVNTVTGGSPVRMAGVSTFDIGNNGYGFFSTMIGNPDIYVYPIDDSLNPYYHSNKSVSIKENEYFTLFLCGTPDAPENVLIKESYSFYQDSVTGIRFINLSPNSSPLNVTLSTSSSVNEFENIAYKEISEFKLYPAKVENDLYVFEVRAADNPDVVLASIPLDSWSIAKLRNATLVFNGIVGGSPGPNITYLFHY